jgi:hypothetical protein
MPRSMILYCSFTTTLSKSSLSGFPPVRLCSSDPTRLLANLKSCEESVMADAPQGHGPKQVLREFRCSKGCDRAVMAGDRVQIMDDIESEEDADEDDEYDNED